MGAHTGLRKTPTTLPHPGSLTSAGERTIVAQSGVKFWMFQYVSQVESCLLKGGSKLSVSELPES